jgi:hypothetical protein
MPSSLSRSRLQREGRYGDSRRDILERQADGGPEAARGLWTIYEAADEPEVWLHRQLDIDEDEGDVEPLKE